MKQFLGLLMMGLVVVACQETETTSEFTGNEVTYYLQPGSAYATSGTVVIKERKDGHSTVQVTLTGTSGEAKLPVHLHLGDIATAGADVAALLNPVDARTGTSETIVFQLADETPLTYWDMIDLEACIKVHLSAVGPEQDIILAGGNIGRSVTKALQSGRVGVGTCKSNYRQEVFKY